MQLEIRNLERQVETYRSATRGYYSSPEYYRIAYLEAKLRRQAEAINSIQKHGWQPQLIIREPRDPDELKVMSGRRQKRRPSIVIQGI